MVAISTEAGSDAANLRQGFARLALCLWLVWFVYWTCAYAMRSQASENHPTPLPLLTLLALAPFLIAALAFGIRWIVSGFRPSD